jgi:hypothetical protein
VDGRYWVWGTVGWYWQGKPKWWETNLPQYHFVDIKYRILELCSGLRNLSCRYNICVQNVECSDVTSFGILNGSCREKHLPLTVFWATWAHSTIWHLISLKSILFPSVFFYPSRVVSFLQVSWLQFCVHFCIRWPADLSIDWRSN